MGMNLGASFGAGGASEALQEMLKQKFLEQIQRQKLEEDRRQADMVNAIQRGQLGQGDRRLGLDERKLGEDTRQFDVGASQRDRTIKLDETEAPLKLRLLGAQAGDIERKPLAEREQRDFVTGRDKNQHGYQMQEIGAQGQNALRVANVRHPDGPAAGPTQKEQNEVEDSLALIQQIRSDKSLPHATGPIDARGVGMVRDLEGVTRVKALHDNLVNKMQLAQAGKLKGQGQISNMEREMLKNAATALDLKLGDPDYLNELAKVEQQFQRMRGGGSTPAAPAAQGDAAARAAALLKKYGGG